MIGAEPLNMFRAKFLKAVWIAVGILSLLLVLVIASSVYVFDAFIVLSISFPLKLIICFTPLGFAILAVSKILHEIIDLGIISNNVSSTQYPIDFFGENPKKLSVCFCRQKLFSAENSSSPLYYCLQGMFSENFIGYHRR